MIDPPKVKVGNYVIIQRQKYTKLHKFGSLDSTAMLGKQKIALRNIAEQNFFSTFKIIPKDGKNKNFCTLEVCSETDIRSLRDVLGIQESGADNRNIVDDGESQALKSEDIDKLREECSGSSQILEKIVENSKTFNSKTEYSQEKYLKKKEKKYFEFVRIRQPSIRFLAEIYFRQNPDEIMGVRIDTLSQIVSYAGVSGYGNFLLFDSGSNGLLPAAFLNSMGAKTESQLVNLHPGNVPQKQAILALNLPEEQTNRCTSVNIYSVLRQFYQGSNETSDTVGAKRKAETNSPEVDEKKARLDPIVEEIAIEKKPSEKLKWQIENEKACEIMKEKFDSLVIVAREHPQTIVRALLPFLKPSRPIVIYNPTKEILMEMYVDLKSSSEVTALHLTSNWLRMYQILPNRTHPEVNMSGNSGYLLTGYSVR